MQEPLKIEYSYTADGKYSVKSMHLKTSILDQRRYFDHFRLDFISPAQKALMTYNAQDNEVFLKYSRTNMSTLFMYNAAPKKIILIKSAFNDLNSIENISIAHSQGLEAQISREEAQNIIDQAEKHNHSLILPPGIIKLPTQSLGSTEIGNFLFEDQKINASAQLYGEYLLKEHEVSEIIIDLEDANNNQPPIGIYYDKLRIRGPTEQFKIYGRGKPLNCDGGAIGVHFTRIK